VLALASFGQMLIVMLGAIDLSVSAIVIVAAGMVVHYGTPGASLFVVIPETLAVGVAISLWNWFFISVLRLNSIIVTLGTLGLVSGGVSIWTGVSFSESGLTPQPIQDLSSASVSNVSACFLIAVVAGILLALTLSKTRGGRQVAAIGSNRRAAMLQGMRVKRVECMAFAGAGLLYAAAGILVAGVVGTPDVSIGEPYQLLTITAIAIAGTAFNGGPASVASVVSACLFLELLDQAMEIYGFSAGPRVVVRGIALLLAVSAITLSQFAVSAIRKGGGRYKPLGQVEETGAESLTPAAHQKETT
jgi:ribose/xylose/arabinose/galactoside ABC-type transport system permease subunit